MRVHAGFPVPLVVAFLAAAIGACDVGEDDDGRVVEPTSSTSISESVGLAIGDHWHAQLAVNECGDFKPVAPAFDISPDGNRAGVHTHGDGFIHFHPFTSDEAGDNATVGTFLEHGGWEVSEDSFELWFGGRRTGDSCPDGHVGTVRWAVNGEERAGNPADYRPEDGDTVVIAFLLEGQEIPPAPDDVIRVQD